MRKIFCCALLSQQEDMCETLCGFMASNNPAGPSAPPLNGMKWPLISTRAAPPGGASFLRLRRRRARLGKRLPRGSPQRHTRRRAIGSLGFALASLSLLLRPAAFAREELLAAATHKCDLVGRSIRAHAPGTGPASSA